MFRFQSTPALWLARISAAMVGLPAGLGLVASLIAYLGGCVVSATASTCAHIPDFVASVLFGLSLFVAFGGWIILAMGALAALLMLGLAVYLEVEARRGE